MLLFLLACTAAAPTIDAITPEVGAAGDALSIVGSNFVEGSSVTLGGQPLAELAVYAATLQARVPEGLSPGPQPLVITSPDGQSVTATFTVKGADPVDLGEPCAGEFTAYSTIVANQEQFVIDRRYKGDDSKNVVARIPFREVKGIEYEEVLLAGGKDDGKVCAAIWVRTRDDTRHLFDDDTEVRLRQRAQEIAVGVQKPFDILAEIKLPEEP